jgi:hypothetical protein
LHTGLPYSNFPYATFPLFLFDYPKNVNYQERPVFFIFPKADTMGQYWFTAAHGHLEDFQAYPPAMLAFFGS